MFPIFVLAFIAVATVNGIGLEKGLTNDSGRTDLVQK